MEEISIDINCDVGEGVGNEEQLFGIISSCNVACGGHVGDLESMNHVVQLAQQNRVKIGAHPSYPDREHFGRVTPDIEPEQLMISVKAQIESLRSVIKNCNAELHHIKPHGALYNDLSSDAVLAQIFVEELQDYLMLFPLYAPHDSNIAKEAARAGFRVIFEAFGDRNYHTDLSLVSRREPQALIESPQRVLAHMLPMIKKQLVTTLNGDSVKILADTYCIHGDTPSALQILMYLSTELPKHHIRIKK